jgi:hypothetical protein
MNHWILKSAPLAVAGVLAITMMLGGGNVPGVEAECMGDAPESLGFNGATTSTAEYQFEFCSDPSLDLQVLINWSNVRKDLALRVTEPNGTVHWVDHVNTTTESYFQAAPLPEGPWQIEVVNKTGGMVKYSESITLG